MLRKSEYFIVRKSRNGRGLFAKKAYEPEKNLFQITGTFTSGDIDENMDDKVRDNLCRFDKNKYINPNGTFGEFINHSCEPNVKMVKKNWRGKPALWAVALRPIQKGDELTFDYSTLAADDDMWEMQCNCGSPLCRGTVKQFSKLPKKLREEYIAKGMVPKYIYS